MYKLLQPAAYNEKEETLSVGVHEHWKACGFTDLLTKNLRECFLLILFALYFVFIFVFSEWTLIYICNFSFIFLIGLDYCKHVSVAQNRDDFKKYNRQPSLKML